MVPFYWEAEVGLALVAFFVGLLCYGVGGLLKAIGAALGTIPLLFGLSLPFGQWFDSITAPVADFFVGLGGSLLGTVTGIFNGIASSLVGVFNWFKDALVNHATQIEYLHNHGIPASAVAVVNTTNAYSDGQLQAVRTEVRAATVKWEAAHTYADAQTYIALERAAPSVEHAVLAGLGTALIAAEVHAQDLHDQLKVYVNDQVAGVKGWVDAGVGARVQGIEGAIAIPTGTAIPNIDVQDLVKTGAKVAIGTAVAVIATKIVECLVSNCPGNNNFADLLKLALGVTDFALFASFIEQVIQHPDVAAATAAGDIQSIVQPLIAGGGDIVSELESLFAL